MCTDMVHHKLTIILGVDESGIGGAAASSERTVMKLAQKAILLVKRQKSVEMNQGDSCYLFRECPDLVGEGLHSYSRARRYLWSVFQFCTEGIVGKTGWGRPTTRVSHCHDEIEHDVSQAVTKHFC